MKNMVLNSINHQPGVQVRQLPHKLLSMNDDSTYFIQFITKNVRYAFGFTLNQCLIREEYLYVFPNGRQQKIYERQNDTIIPGDKYKGKFELCKSALKPNRLLLSCAANFSQIEDIMHVFSFFRDELIIYTNGINNNWLEYSLKTIATDDKMKKSVLKLLNNFGTGIKDLIIDIKEKKLNYDEIPSFLSDEVKLEIIKQNAVAINTSVVYEQFQVDLLRDESQGIKKLIEFICPFIDIIFKGKILICDEIETSLHESIVYEIFKYFKYSKLITGECPQMISTTHDTSLLNLNLFRRDQIWFTELNVNERSTDLYSLSEIKNVRKDDNIEKGYISGKYGAIPMLNNDFFTKK